LKNDKKRTGDMLALIMLQTNFKFIRVNDLTTQEVIFGLEKCQMYLN
jgi:hypothetical protein